MDISIGKSDGKAPRNTQKHDKKHRDSLNEHKNYIPSCTEDHAIEQYRIAVTEQRYSYWEMCNTGTDVNTTD